MKVSYLFLILTFVSVAKNINLFVDGTPPDNNSKRLLNGRDLVVGTIELIPYIFIKRARNNISNVDGFVHKIVEWMAEKYDFTYHYVDPIDGSFGAFVNGSWNGLIGMLYRGEIDIAATSLSITYPRFAVSDFTIPYSHEPIVLLIPYPKLESSILLLVKPFQYEVWLGIILSLIIAAIVLGLISKFESYNNANEPLESRRNSKWFSHFWFLFRVVASPSAEIHFSLPTRLVVAGWCLTTIVVIYAYAGSLVSYLMNPRLIPIFNTVQELADSNEIKIAALKDSSIDSRIYAATSGPLVQLAASLRAHPENQVLDTDNIPDKVYSQHQEIAMKMWIYNDFKATNQCRLSIAKEPLFPDRHAFGMKKQDPMTQIFNYELMLLDQMGLVGHWKASFTPPATRCSKPTDKQKTRTNAKLTLDNLSSAFLVYGVGVVAAIVVFILERLFFSWTNRTRAVVVPITSIDVLTTEGCVLYVVVVVIALQVSHRFSVLCGLCLNKRATLCHQALAHHIELE